MYRYIYLYIIIYIYIIARVRAYACVYVRMRESVLCVRIRWYIYHVCRRVVTDLDFFTL